MIIPIYEYQCPDCKEEKEEILHIEDLGEAQVVCMCGVPMNRVFATPRNVICDLEPYIDENIDRKGVPIQVESRRHRRQLMKDNHLFEAG